MWRPEDWDNRWGRNGYEKEADILEDGADEILLSLSKLPFRKIVHIINDIRIERLEEW